MSKTIAERLGHPPNAKLLVVHADDLGLSHSIDAASFLALEKGAVTSASVMVVCPWFTEVANYTQEHPQADLGIHLTLTSEWKGYRWGPAAARNRVRSLVGANGYFWESEQLVTERADPTEVETELQAQLDRAFRAGIRPTHLDSHMFVLHQRPDLFGVLVKVASSAGLPFLCWKQIPFLSWREMKEIWGRRGDIFPMDIALDSVVSGDASMSRAKVIDFFAKVLRGLGPGVHQLIVHLGQDNAELQAITGEQAAFNAAWRAADFSAVTSPRFKRLLQENQVILVSWKDLGKLLD